MSNNIMFIELTNTDGERPILVNINEIECVIENKNDTEVHFINDEEVLAVREKVSDIKALIRDCLRSARHE